MADKPEIITINTRQMGLNGKRPYVECTAYLQGTYGKERWIGRMVQEVIVNNTRYLAIRWKIANGVAQGLYTYEVIAEESARVGMAQAAGIYGPQYRALQLHTAL